MDPAGTADDARSTALIRWAGWGHALGRAPRKLIAGSVLLIVFAIVACFAEFIAPYDYREQNRREPGAPPSALHFRDTAGSFHFRPFIYSLKLADPLTRRYDEQTARSYPISFFTRGSSYQLLGIYRTNVHLFGVDPSGSQTAPRIQILGNDDLGRDRFSRLLAASRFSLIVSPAGAILASCLGILLGCLAGYAGRLADGALMRIADAMMALPVLVLVLAARAAFPPELPPLRAATLVISIFVAVGWAEMARLSRGLVLSLRHREFVTAAISVGASRSRVLFRHILPNSMRPLTIQFLLMLPAFLLTETSLSFLGVGLQEPEPSWGNMLTSASDLTLLRSQPLVLLSPAICIFLFVLAVRLVSDGISSRGAEARP